MKQSVFIDTDVVLDFLLDREPFSSFASVIFTYSEGNEIKAYISPITISNSYCILRKLASHNKVIDTLQKLLLVTNITTISKKDIVSALHSNFKDLEDAVQHFSAISHSNIDVLLTRNLKDYKNSEIPVMSPETYLKTFSLSSGA